MTSALGTGALRLVSGGQGRTVCEIGDNAVAPLGLGFVPATGGGIAGAPNRFRIAIGDRKARTGSVNALVVIDATMHAGMRNAPACFGFTLSGTGLSAMPTEHAGQG